MAAGEDLVRWQHKTIPSGISEFYSERIIRLGNICNVVNAITSSLVYGTANRSWGELCAKQCSNRVRGATGQRLVFVIVSGKGTAGIAVRGHEELRVRVPVNVQLQPLGGLDGGKLGNQALGLWSVTGSLSLEVLCARVGRGTAGDGPLVWPVAVDVVAQTAAAGGGLAILAPQAIGGLSVEETCCA